MPASPTVVHEIPASVLAVYGHPDDPEISAGGTLARWARGGATVWELICTKGEKGSQDPNQDTGALAATRVAETEKAATVLGLAGHFHLGYGDGELRDDLEIRSRIVELVRQLKPQVVVCPDPTAVFFGDRYFNHSDHRVTGWATLDAVAPGAGNPHYFPDQLAAGLTVHSVSSVYLSGTLEPNCWVDIGDDIETKIDALFCHASQLTETGEWFREFLRERAEEGGRAAGVRYAEGFRRLSFGG
ncbi:MAG TPA: PIG-L deacetylase family protein [Acidimicrobiia bacterium]|nr:PIG-L deacetylase family protein [Acidimicrobiia bacterium]